MALNDDPASARVAITGHRLVIDMTDGIGTLSLDGVDIAPSGVAASIDLRVGEPVVVTIDTIGRPVERIKAALAERP